MGETDTVCDVWMLEPRFEVPAWNLRKVSERALLEFTTPILINDQVITAAKALDIGQGTNIGTSRCRTPNELIRAE